MKKINFTNNQAPALNDSTLNQLQTNVENAIEEKHTYLTTEQRIGTWIDGKPLYRKVIDTTLPTPNGEYVSVGSISSLDTLTNLSGTFCDNGINIWYQIPASSNGFDLVMAIQNSNLLVKNKVFSGGYLKIIAEYTKTTD